jgi:divalent metal cation (Fe/Co/Zn/Cd) transporter
VHVEPRRRGLDLRDRVLAAALGEPLVREAHDLTIYEQDGRCSISLHLKLPEDLPLERAHEVAERVEAAVRSEPGVDDVQTHLEPLEHPLAVVPVGDRRDGELERTIAKLVRRRTLALDTDANLADAHRLASELEEDLRRQHPFIADVVVHTEPG